MQKCFSDFGIIDSFPVQLIELLIELDHGPGKTLSPVAVSSAKQEKIRLSRAEKLVEHSIRAERLSQFARKKAEWSPPPTTGCRASVGLPL
ncbi:hypothetical protein V5E97_24045 [Singulisphaera sp. Ch08]|uniref:Uncharacterized protein n=1 Tax=Singulisphaera sp. Ch08 TaxID=3120278 RepID=A0AAU7C7P6_9BACT